MCPQHYGSLSLSYDFRAAVRWRPMPKTGHHGAWSSCPTSENFSTAIPPPSPLFPAIRCSPEPAPCGSFHHSLLPGDSRMVPGLVPLRGVSTEPLWLFQRGLNTASYCEVSIKYKCLQMLRVPNQLALGVALQQSGSRQ